MKHIVVDTKGVPLQLRWLYKSHACGNCCTCYWWDIGNNFCAYLSLDQRFPEYSIDFVGFCRRYSPMRGGFEHSCHACDWCGEYEFYGNYE